MRRITFLSAVSVVLVAGLPAHAGFEWVPPAQTEKPQMQVVVPTTPSANILTPMPGDTTVTTTQITTQAPAAPAVVAMPPVPPPPAPTQTIAWNEPAPAPISAVAPPPVAAAPTPLAPMPAPIPMAPAQPRASIEDPLFKPAIAEPRELVPAKPKTDLVEGFGRDVPLTVATQQIVPTEYSVQYAPGVEPSQAVTWKGGKAWKTVLQDALKERDLKATIVADSVLIESTKPMVAAAPAPVEPPAPVIVAAPVMPDPPQNLAASAAPTQLAPMNEVIVETRPGEAAPMVAETTTTVTTTTAAASSNGIYDAGAPAIAAAPVAASVAPVAYTPPAPAVQVWVAPRASTLRQILSDWSQLAGVQLQWSAQYDYPLMSDVQITGSFEEAVETLLSGLVDAQPRPVARLHPNEPNGPAILVVETRHILE